MRHFKVDSEEYGIALSEKLYSIMYAEGKVVVTRYLFQCRTLAGVSFISVEEKSEPIFEKQNTAEVAEFLGKDESVLKGKQTESILNLLPELEEISQQWVDENSPKDEVIRETKGIDLKKMNS